MAGPLADLLQTIRTLRAPGGCPWDRKQNLHDAARYLMDEAGELVEATLTGDADGACEELADLLFMTCFCTQILSETVDVDMNAIARLGNEKLVRRHPHVFGDTEASDTVESQEQWNAIKAAEKRARGIDPDRESVLKDLPAATAPLHQAYHYQHDAAATGFDWPTIDGVWAKLHEETNELVEAVAQGDQDHIEHELGDVLFSVVNLSRRLGVQPDMALRRANKRFAARFHQIEDELRDNDRKPADASLAELEAAWQRAKQRLSE